MSKPQSKPAVHTTFLSLSASLYTWLTLLILGATTSVEARPAAPTGHVIAFGWNDSGQTAVPFGLQNVTAIAAGLSHNLALLANGTVVAWGSNANGESNVPVGLTNVIAIAAARHSVALLKDGTIVIWGSNSPEVTTIPSAAVGIKAIDAGWSSNGTYTLALRNDGKVLAWGSSSLIVGAVPPGLQNVVAIGAGISNALAVKDDGTVVSWAVQFSGQPPIPAGLTGVVAARSGQGSSLAVKRDGTVIQWGDQFTIGEVPQGMNGVIDLQVGNQHAVVLRTNGTVQAWGFAPPSTIPAEVQSVIAIAAKGNHTLVLTPAPKIDFISSSRQLQPGESFTLASVVLGTQLRYQWKHLGKDLAGQTNSSLTITNVQLAHAGVYSLSVSNPFGSVLSREIRISFPHPEITQHPQSQILYRGEDAQFTVAASGLSPFTFTWLKDGALIPGGAGATLVVTNIRSLHAGNYRAVITDIASVSRTSAPALLTVKGSETGQRKLDHVLRRSIHKVGGNPLDDTLLVGTRGSKSGSTDRGFMKFDLSVLAPGEEIISANVQIAVVQAPNGPSSYFSLHRMITPWDSNATWVNATGTMAWGEPGALAGTDYLGTATTTQLIHRQGLYIFPSTPALIDDLRTWIANPAANQGWLLKSEAEQTNNTARHFGWPELWIEHKLIRAMPQLTNLATEADTLTFELQGEEAVIYRVEAREDFGAGEWITVTNAPAGAGTLPVRIALPMSGPRRFYRVIAE